MNVLFPVFALAALTFFVLCRLAVLRYGAASRREVDVAYYEAYQGKEPLKLHVTARHLSNLFEVPVLFYTACLMAFATQQTGTPIVALAWGFVVLRYVHSAIHLGSNIVIWRFRVFILSVAALAALWVLLLMGLLAR